MGKAPAAGWVLLVVMVMVEGIVVGEGDFLLFRVDPWELGALNIIRYSPKTLEGKLVHDLSH